MRLTKVFLLPAKMLSISCHPNNTRAEGHSSQDIMRLQNESTEMDSVGDGVWLCALLGDRLLSV